MENWLFERKKCSRLTISLNYPLSRESAISQEEENLDVLKKLNFTGFTSLIWKAFLNLKRSKEVI